MSRPEWPEWALAWAHDLQECWDRNDEDLCSLTVTHNIARALNDAKEVGRILGNRRARPEVGL